MGGPAVVLVHGTWHGAWCWSVVRDRLDRRGIVSFAPTLTGMGERFDEATEDVGVAAHVADVVDAIRAADRPCVVVGHSYGSIPMWGAAAALPDRVVGLVDVDGFLPQDGESAFTMVPKLGRGVERLRNAARPWLLDPPDPSGLGITDPVDAERARQLMTPAPLRTHTDVFRLAAPPWSGPRVYVAASATASLFRETIRRATADGWTIWNLTGGHDLPVVDPDGVADAITHAVTMCR